MHKLELTQYPLAQPLFAELSQHHLALAAVLAGTAPGEVYVNSLTHPQVGFAKTYEGHFLAGNPDHRHDYRELKKIIPNHAYLVLQPAEWEHHLSRVWENRAARRHTRQHLRLQTLRLAHYQALIPPEFELVRVDQALLNRPTLTNHATLTDWVASWHSVDYFLQHGFGFCLLQGEHLASWCLADCVYANRCEIGIITDRSFRRRGLASIVVAAAVAHCLARGLTDIGWHCLSTNLGSIAVAEKVGFVKDYAYSAYSHTLPAENAADLTPAEYADWAKHYERFIPLNPRFALRAAEAWAMAGERAQALANLQRFSASNGLVSVEWLVNNWRLASLRGEPVYDALLAQLRAQANAG